MVLLDQRVCLDPLDYLALQESQAHPDSTALLGYQAQLEVLASQVHRVLMAPLAALAPLD